VSLFDDLYTPAFASDAADLFKEANAAVPDTQRQAYRELRQDLPRRQGLVLLCLTRYVSAHKEAPTAYELFTYMAREGAAADINDVRPRLTELHDRELIKVTGRRVCRVKGNRAMTWAPTRTNGGE
jgi:hypothetical protein